MVDCMHVLLLSSSNLPVWSWKSSPSPGLSATRGGIDEVKIQTQIL